MGKRKSRITLDLTEKNYEKLVRRANYLGTTPTSIVFLLFYLHQDKNYTEDELEKELHVIQSDKNQKNLAISLQTYLENIIKVKKRYFFTNPEFISIYLNIFLNDEVDMFGEMEQKQGKRTAIFWIDPDLNNWFVEFSEKTKISQTTLINYCLMVSESLNPYVHKKNNREKKGVHLTEINLEEIKKIEYDKRASVIENCIQFYKKTEY